MKTVNIPIEEWNNIMNLNYWWIVEAIKQEVGRGVRYKLENYDGPCIIGLDDDNKLTLFSN
jgi:hypothetical protein